MGGQSRRGDVFDLGAVLRWALALGAVALVFASTPSPLAQIGIGLLIFLAAFAGGAIIGFIFSVPRAVDPAAIAGGGATPDDPGTGSTAEALATPPPAPRRGRLLNTNTALERVSEWLATMLVGVGLSQLYNVNNWLIDFRDFLVKFGPAGSALPAIGPLILIAGLVAGFMYLYVYTRLILPAAFYTAEAINSGLLDPASSAAVKTLASITATANTQEAVGAPPVSPAETFTLTTIANAPRPTVDSALALMLGLLGKPGGFAQVIDLGAQLANSEAAKRGEFWFYLARAFGQLHAATPAEDSAGRSLAAKNASLAAANAIARDPSLKARLLSLVDPRATDRDLQSLRDNPEFMAALH